jgi:hypothetical protein
MNSTTTVTYSDYDSQCQQMLEEVEAIRDRIAGDIYMGRFYSEPSAREEAELLLAEADSFYGSLSPF